MSLADLRTHELHYVWLRSHRQIRDPLTSSDVVGPTVPGGFGIWRKVRQRVVRSAAKRIVVAIVVVGQPTRLDEDAPRSMLRHFDA